MAGFSTKFGQACAGPELDSWRLGCCGLRRRGSSSVSVERQRIDHQRVAEQIRELTGMAEAVRASEIQRVIQAAVDRFDVVPSPEQRLEVRIGWRDDADVLGSIEAPGAV